MPTAAIPNAAMPSAISLMPEVFRSEPPRCGSFSGELFSDVAIARHAASNLARAGSAYNREGTHLPTKITHRRGLRAGLLILVVVALDVAAVQYIVLSLRKFDDDDDNGKDSNGEKNHRHDHGRRVGSHRWPPPAPEWLISLPSARSQSLLLPTVRPSDARGFHGRLFAFVRDLSLPSRLRPAWSHSEIQAQRASGVFVPPRS
jgi:hypothetical protein